MTRSRALVVRTVGPVVVFRLRCTIHKGRLDELRRAMGCNPHNYEETSGIGLRTQSNPCNYEEISL